MTVELNLDPLMESRSAPMLILEVFLLLFIRVQIILRTHTIGVISSPFFWAKARGRDLVPLRPTVGLPRSLIWTVVLENYDFENISTLD